MPWAPEEISAWSIDELEAEIASTLPAGWKLFSQHTSEGYWELSVRSTNEDGQSVVHLERENADRRLGLLDVYGWIWLEKSPKPPAGSPWSPRQGLTIGIISGHANIRGSKIPDPEDLDPVEIALVHKSRK